MHLLWLFDLRVAPLTIPMPYSQDDRKAPIEKLQDMIDIVRMIEAYASSEGLETATGRADLKDCKYR
jgi:hypothetical protein